VKKTKIFIFLLFLCLSFLSLKTTRAVNCSYESDSPTSAYSTYANPQYWIIGEEQRIRIPSFNCLNNTCTWYIADTNGTRTITSNVNFAGMNFVNYMWSTPGDYEIRASVCDNKLLMKNYDFGNVSSTADYKNIIVPETVTKSAPSGNYIGFVISRWRINWEITGLNPNPQIYDEFTNGRKCRYDSPCYIPGPEEWWAYGTPVADGTKTTYSYTLDTTDHIKTFSGRVHGEIYILYRPFPSKYYWIKIPPVEIIPSPPPTTIKHPPFSQLRAPQTPLSPRRVAPFLGGIVKSYKKK